MVCDVIRWGIAKYRRRVATKRVMVETALPTTVGRLKWRRSMVYGFTDSSLRDLFIVVGNCVFETLFIDKIAPLLSPKRCNIL